MPASLLHRSAGALAHPACSAVSRPTAAVPAGTRLGRHRMVALAAAALEAAPQRRLESSAMEPLGDRVLIRPLQKKDVGSPPIVAQQDFGPVPALLPVVQVTEGGLYLATSGDGGGYGQDAEFGTVLAVGSEVDIGVQVQDTVLFAKYSSSDVKLEEGKVHFVAQKSVLAILS